MIAFRYIILQILAVSAIAFSCDSPAEPAIDTPAAPVSEATAFSLDTLRITIESDDFQKIVEKRQAALALKKLIKSKDDYVPARISHNGTDYKVKLRLKGDLPDHWKGDRWSYRIKTKGGKQLLGMSKFSIQDPETRNGIWEWIFQKLLEEEGLMYIKYEFVYVIQNGEPKGVYALEEHFRDELLARKNKTGGVILCYDESDYWDAFQKIPDDREAMYAIYANHFKTAPIRPYNDNAFDEDVVLAARYARAAGLLERFRNGEAIATEVFDVEKLGAYFALTDLLGAFHATLWGNMRFYYDPETQLIEPIGFDADAGYLSDNISGNNAKLQMLNGQFHAQLFNDDKFVEAYHKYLKIYSNKGFYSAFLNKYNQKLSEVEKVLQINTEGFVRDPSVVDQNRAMIVEQLQGQ